MFGAGEHDMFAFRLGASAKQTDGVQSGLRMLATGFIRGNVTKKKLPRIHVSNLEGIHCAYPLRLDNIRDNDGAKKEKVRIGRGRGSGCGKTSGRGQKGQRARNSVRLGFEGGQTPLHKRFPKRNHFDPFARKLEPLTLGRLQSFIDIGRIRVSEDGAAITMHQLVRSGCIGKPVDGVILVKGGAFAEKVHVEVTESEPDAATQVLAAGGKVTLAWYNKLGLRALIKPEKWTEKNLPLPRWARPPPKFEHRYPERTEDGLPVRVLASQQDIDELGTSWKRIVHLREAKKVI